MPGRAPVDFDETPDYLANLKPPEVAAFYRRLATHINSLRGGKSLSANMLLHWLDASGSKYVFPGSYLTGVSYVEDYLLNSVRPVLLSKKKGFEARHLGGIVPRIRRDKPLNSSIRASEVVSVS